MLKCSGGYNNNKNNKKKVKTTNILWRQCKVWFGEACLQVRFYQKKIFFIRGQVVIF